MPDAAPAPLLFGVLNVTPDSFSDGGRHLDPDVAVARGLALVALGADVVDVGGESTRPGAAPVAPEEELRRVLPVVRGLVAAGVAVSIDTRRAAVAEHAVAAGATTVNDVDGGEGDPRMRGVVAAGGADYVVMHSRGPSASPGRYTDLVPEVVHDLLRRTGAALAAGVPVERLVVDPGIGFSKSAAESWTLLSRLDEVAAALPGVRMLVGASRKRFLADLLPAGAPPEARDPATAVLSGLLAAHGLWALRVHDVAASRTAIAVARRMWAAA